MKNILKKLAMFSKSKSTFSIILSVLASVFLVSVVVFAASTIDLNISTGGSLTVSGTSATSTFSTGGLTVGTSQFVVQQSTGKVGIGTITPSHNLHIYDSSSIPSLKVESGSGINDASIFVKTVSGATNPVNIIFVEGSGAGPTPNGYWETGYLPSGDYFYIAGGDTFIEKVVITDAGKFGIGTTSPGALLGVNGDILGAGKLSISYVSATSTTASSTFQGLVVNRSLTVANNVQASGILNITSSGTSTVAGNLEITGYLFAEGGKKVLTPSNFITPDEANGRFGISTSTPGTPLSVTGAGVFTGPVTARYFFATTTLATSTMQGLAVNQSLEVSNNVTVSGSLTVNSYFTAAGSASVLGALSVSGALSATQATTTFNGVSAGFINSSNNLQAAGLLKLTGSGTSTIAGNFEVTGKLLAEGGERVCTSGNSICTGVGTINSGTANRLSYYSGATTLDSANHLAVDTSASRLGIGTSTPGTPLSVTGAGVFTGPVTAPYFLATSTSATSTIGGGLAIDGNGFVYDYSSNRVGIGTAAPANLDYNSNLNIGLDVANGGISLANNSSLSFKVAGNNNRVPVVQVTSGDVLNIGDMGNLFGTVNFHAGGSSRAYLTNAGYFGLASTTPGAMLAVRNENNYAGFIVSDEANETTPFIVDPSGNVGIGTPIPQTKLEVNGTASTTGLIVGGGATLTKHISTTASLDFTLISPNECVSTTTTVVGAADGDVVSLGVPNSVASTTKTVITSFVSAADTVTIRACMHSSGNSVDPPAGTVRINIWKY